MFCEKCGKKLKENHKFCTECGHSNLDKQKSKQTTSSILEQKWWFRLAKVFYIFLYIPLPFVMIGVWSENNPYSYYSSYSNQYYNHGSYGEAFWYSLLTFIVWVTILRLIKITFLYIALGGKPQWKKEFKKLF